jgi:2-oxo-4-hydroxy-4-carboxy-5-ureidoimidazoline decarboxylase
MHLDAVNRMDLPAFVAAFGDVFEHSPWVAEGAFAARPFASTDALHGSMVDVVRSATRDQRLALLRAHPDLAGKEAAAGTMTRSSVSEQSSVGLDNLTAAELKRIGELNAAYRAKHGFPFIIAVRRYTKTAILDEFARRLANDSETEFAADLQQVFVIARLRLDRLIDGESSRQ